MANTSGTYTFSTNACACFANCRSNEIRSGLIYARLRLIRIHHRRHAAHQIGLQVWILQPSTA